MPVCRSGVRHQSGNADIVVSSPAAGKKLAEVSQELQEVSQFTPPGNYIESLATCIQSEE